MAMVERKTTGERILNGTNIAVLIMLTILFLYPMWHCLMASFSDPKSLIGYRGFLFTPNGFSLEGYRVVFLNPNIPIGYGNTLRLLPEPTEHDAQEAADDDARLYDVR